MGRHRIPNQGKGTTDALADILCHQRVQRFDALVIERGKNLPFQVAVERSASHDGRHRCLFRGAGRLGSSGNPISAGERSGRGTDIVYAKLFARFIDEDVEEQFVRGKLGMQAKAVSVVHDCRFRVLRGGIAHQTAIRLLAKC